MKLIFFLSIILMFGCGLDNDSLSIQYEECVKYKMYPMVQSFNNEIVIGITCLPLSAAKSMVNKESYDEYLKILKEREVKWVV